MSNFLDDYLDEAGGSEFHQYSQNEEAQELVEQAKLLLDGQHEPPSETLGLLRKALGFLCADSHLENVDLQHAAKLAVAYAIAVLEESPPIEPN